MKILKSTKGLTLAEILIAIAVSIIVLSAVASLYYVSDRAFKRTKASSDVKEIAKGGMAGLEWLFQRWGTATPCNDPTGNNQCTPVIDCRVAGQYNYPPPSSMCITIIDNTIEGSPCDDVIFYGSLYGNGFVDRVSGPTTVALMSCRLSTDSNQNCYHIKRGGQFIRDYQNNANVLIFSLSSLGSSNLECINVTSSSNTTASRQVTALNGNLLDASGNPTPSMNLEGGDLLLRVPHRIRLFCGFNVQDNNTIWLYMQATDMSTNCNANEPAQPIMPIRSFDAEQFAQGVRVTIQARGPDGQVTRVQRYFGR